MVLYSRVLAAMHGRSLMTRPNASLLSSADLPAAAKKVLSEVPTLLSCLIYIFYLKFTDTADEGSRVSSCEEGGACRKRRIALDIPVLF